MAATVIYLLGSYPVWSETFLRQDLSLLQAAGVPLCPLSLFPGDTAPQPDWPRVECLTPGGAPGGAPTGRSRGRLWGCLPARCREAWSLGSHRGLRRALASAAREVGAVHIHAEFADLPGLLAAAAARDCGLSYSLGLHARDVHQPKYRLGAMLGGARFVTVCNAAAYEAARAACPAAAALHLIPHGIDLSAWPFLEAPFAPGPPLRLLYAGRLVEKKGVDTLLQALAILAREGLPCHLALAGDGPLGPSLKALAADLGIAASLDWLGVLTHDGVRQALSQADALVAPSRVGRDGDRDGVPNVLLEAMARGVPVVGTSVGGLGEVLDEDTGWVVPPDAPAALAAALQGLTTPATAVAAAETRRRAARDRLEARYDARRLATQRAALFEAVLENHRGG